MTLRALSILVLLLATACSEKPRDIFNGKDLDGWETWLGPEFSEETNGFTGTTPGINSDADNVFTIAEVDGEPAIRISGKHFGGISTLEEFHNYHLTLEFKWGQAKYAPKDSAVRDSGLLYHAVGAHGADYGFWMRSQEFQIQEGDCGDYWGVAGGIFDVPVIEQEGRVTYSSTGKLIEFSEKGPHGRHAIKNPDAEKPSGQWNVLDLYCMGDTAVHVVNGKVNMVLYRSRQAQGDGAIPLKAGKIQLQSEGAEVFYRNIRVEKIKALPARLLSKNQI
jgi:hypothetical protein